MAHLIVFRIILLL